MQYRLDDALLHFEQASAAFEAAGDRQGQALVTLGIGGTYIEAGRFDEGLVCLEQAKASLGEMGDHRSQVWALRRLGTLHQRQERYEQAAGCFQQALFTAGRIEDPVLEARVLERLGEVRTIQGRGGDAHPILERALRLHREYGDPFGEACALGSLGELHHSEAQPDQALNCLLAEELPWLHWLPEQERWICIRELLAHLVAGADTGLMLPFSRALTSWRSTAEVWSDPQLAHELQGPFVGDGPPVSRPRSGAA